MASPPANRDRFIDLLLNRRTLPVFLMFFFWGFGTGGLWLVRPLYAFSLTDSFLLVALVSAISAAPRTLTAAIAGYLTDRFGRKPFIIVGAAIHIVALTGQYFSGSYWPFFMLEILGGVGISTWMTASNALMADETHIASRGRVVALRQTSSRIRLLAGPGDGGAGGGDHYAADGIPVHRGVQGGGDRRGGALGSGNRTHGRRAAGRSLAGEGAAGIDLSMFGSRAFFALAVGTFAVSLVTGGTGVFRTFFPVQGTVAAGLDELQVGNLIAASGILALVAAIPGGDGERPVRTQAHAHRRHRRHEPSPCG